MITVQQAFTQAFAHEAAGRRDAAAAIYRQILVAIPDHPGALLMVAQRDLADGRSDVARDRLQRALAAARRERLPDKDILVVLGNAEVASGDARAAAEAYTAALAQAPSDPAANMGYGVLLLRQRQPAAAERHFRAAAASGAYAAPALTECALALAAQRRWTDAHAIAQQALALAPASLHGCQVLCYTALRNGQPEAVAAAARDGLSRHPGDTELQARLADALRAMGRTTEARQQLESALAKAPDDRQLLASVGAIYLGLDLLSDARKALRRAVAGGAAAATWDHLGLVERAHGDYPAALEAFARALELDPLLTPACSNLVTARQEACTWDALEAERARWITLASDEAADPRCNPFVAVTQPTTPIEQLAIARRWSRHTLPPVAPRGVAVRGSRLRVGYLSGDLHEHATARLIAGLFAAHDRQRCEIFVFSHGPDDGSAIRARMQATTEHWADVAALSDDAAARRIRAAEVDVLIDLKGHTQDARLGILARRPATLQLHYLGFPGTLGYDAIDGIVADDIVVPAGDERHFHERVYRLPRCYQVTDRERELPDPTPRAALGLPDDAVVLACFNQSYKLSREFFAFWLDALARIPRAVLWIYAPIALARENLVAEARAACADTTRIVFADTLPQHEHLARLRAADLALDVLPCGSHTTGSDALWAGVPLLSCRGGTFAGRVGASLLHAVGLDELVAESPQQYHASLLRLAADRAALAGYRAYLDRERLRLPLFDTAGFARDWETLLATAWEESTTAPMAR